MFTLFISSIITIKILISKILGAIIKKNFDAFNTILIYESYNTIQNKSISSDFLQILSDAQILSGHAQIFFGDAKHTKHTAGYGPANM